MVTSAGRCPTEEPMLCPRSAVHDVAAAGRTLIQNAIQASAVCSLRDLITHDGACAGRSPTEDPTLPLQRRTAHDGASAGPLSDQERSLREGRA